MTNNSKPVSIITGGASGIGKALGTQLARSGARVILADRNGPLAQETAGAIAACGGSATGVELDVTDAAAVRSVVEEAAMEYGRIDFMFNNAGVSMVSEVRDMNAEDWSRLVDVNLRGVVNGIQAVYPIMIKQGSGHIVNTASITGLAPFALSAGYNATKHAIVGLSLSMRGEAQLLGVKVSVVCPGFIDTPLKDSIVYRHFDKQASQQALPFKLQSVERCASDILKGVRRNRAIIVTTWEAKALWLFFRLFPSLYLRVNAMAARMSRNYRREEAS